MLRLLATIVVAICAGSGVSVRGDERPAELFSDGTVESWPLPSLVPEIVPEEAIPVWTPPPAAFSPPVVQLDEGYGGEDDWTWQLLPNGVLYHTYWASAAEPRMSTQIVAERGNGPYIDSHIGGRLGIVRFGSRAFPEGWQFDVLGGAKLRQNAGEELDVEAVDFRYDLLLTRAQGPHRWKFGFYHVSAHTGDEYLLKNPLHERLNFLRDTVVLGYSYYPMPTLRLYGELGYAFYTDISEPLEVQFGFDYGPAHKTGPQGAPFLAMNGHLREELEFGGNFALQAGWAWKSDRLNDGTLRTGLYLYEGASPQFSFFHRYERQIGVGLWYDY